MSVVAAVLMLLGGLVAILAGVGIVRLDTPYARFHAAGKASPIAFLIAAIGAAIELAPAGVAYLTIAGLAMVLTLPVGIHFLFRAVHRTQPADRPKHDELTAVEAGTRPEPTDNIDPA
ncbi:MAG: cation:proton antiporter [Acidimicrobiales bacterium]